MENILQASHTAEYPYWRNSHIQYPNMIPGGMIAREIQDIGINRIPSETDYQIADVRVVPVPGSPNQQIRVTQAMEVNLPEQGHGAAVTLTDMLVMSMNSVNQIGGNV